MNSLKMNFLNVKIQSAEKKKLILILGIIFLFFAGIVLFIFFASTVAIESKERNIVDFYNKIVDPDTFLNIFYITDHIKE